MSEGKKKQRKKISKIENFMFDFYILRKVSGTYQVHLAIEKLMNVVCKLFVLLSFLFHGAAVQVAISNLPHPYLRSTLVLLDDKISRTVVYVHVSKLQSQVSIVLYKVLSRIQIC